MRWQLNRRVEPDRRPSYSRPMILSRFTDRNAIVTGAASGIGRATALRLFEEGASVVACDVNADALAGLLEAAEGIEGAGTITTAVLDVSSEDEVKHVVAAAVGRMGSLHVVVNAAGVLSFHHAHEHSLAEWNRLVAINLTGTFLMCRESIPHLLATRGNVVNLASTSAHRGQPWAAGYAATKGGILAMTKTMAVDYAAQRIRFNTISPGAIDTPITNSFSLPEGADPKLLDRVTPAGRFGTPEGIAAAIAFVASDEGRHMNGSDIVIDGGATA